MWTSTAQEADKILLLARTTPKDECAKPTHGMSIFYTDLDRSKVEVRRIAKLGRNAVDSNAVFIDDLFVHDEDLFGEEGRTEERRAGTECVGTVSSRWPPVQEK